VRLGLLTPYAVQMLRHLKDFFGVVFNIKTENESQTIFLSCLGAGLKNVARRVA
jgi:RNA 3'-terminal phosphate cyclase-like protein